MLRKCTVFLFIFILLVNHISAQKEDAPSSPRGKVTGEVFGDYYYKIQGDTLNPSTEDGYQQVKQGANAFALRRVYLGYSYHFNRKFITKILFEGNDGQLLANGARSVNIKYFYLKVKDIFPGSHLMIGGQPTPTFATFTEKIWGYRSIEKSAVEFRHFGCSNDFGLSLSGKLNKSKTLGYYVMIGNGSAQRPEINIFKKIYGAINGQFFNKKILFEMYADLEKQSGGLQKMTFKGFAGYQSALFTIGFEPYEELYTQNRNITLQTFGFALFSHGTLIQDRLTFFARYDLFKPDANRSVYNETFAVFGLDYTPMKNIHFMPNIWINSYSAMGSANVHPSDIIARITFWFKY